MEQCVSVLLDCSARGLSVFLCGETHSDVSLLVCSWGTLTRSHSQTRPITTFLWFVWISSLFDDYDYKHASLWNAPWMSTFLPLDTVEAIVSSFPSPRFSLLLLCSRKYLCYWHVWCGDVFSSRAGCCQGPHHEILSRCLGADNNMYCDSTCITIDHDALYVLRFDIPNILLTTLYVCYRGTRESRDKNEFWSVMEINVLKTCWLAI